MACKSRLALRFFPIVGLIGAAAATLVGCTCPPPHPPSAQFGKTTRFTTNGATHVVAAKARPLPSAQLNAKADHVMEKAKAAIARMMQNPASAEFGDMRRGMKTLLGETLDTICGQVKGKNASGGDTGEMPFLYIVNHEEAYLVDGSTPTADTVHRVICDESTLQSN